MNGVGNGPKASLDLTHVLYDDGSYTSFALALVTLSPILLMASYAALVVQTRELVIIEMWLGQLACEGFNWILKRSIKQDRPVDTVGNGYGFPSSHSQYMGYFASFLICHLHFRHRFTPSGSPILDQAFRITLYAALLAWAGCVAYSRYHLTYHSEDQILWGVGIGAFLGTIYYFVAELLPLRLPSSIFGATKTYILRHPVVQWCRIRDGWAVWEDGGHEQEWQRWKVAFESQITAEQRKEQ